MHYRLLHFLNIGAIAGQGLRLGSYIQLGVEDVGVGLSSPAVSLGCLMDNMAVVRVRLGWNVPTWSEVVFRDSRWDELSSVRHGYE